MDLMQAESKSPSEALSEPDWPEAWPYTEFDLSRRDEAPDSVFYAEPRLVTHIDDAAIDALQTFYASHPAFKDVSRAAVLDIASSWISHYPRSFDGIGDLHSGARVAGLGMNVSTTMYYVPLAFLLSSLPFMSRSTSLRKIASCPSTLFEI